MGRAVLDINFKLSGKNSGLQSQNPVLVSHQGNGNPVAPKSLSPHRLVRKDMSFPNQTTLKSAIADLKEVVTRLHGSDAEPVRLLRQIENCAQEIETRVNVPIIAAAALVNPAQVMINPGLANPAAPPIII
jgi:hypothetical protein